MQIVNIETAKLAKEKGFSIGCDWQYDEFGNIVDGLYMPHYFKAPYQYQLMDWLREKRNIYISILQTNLPLTDPQTDEWEWGYYIYEIDDPNNLLKSNWEFETYEECLETALQEALKMI